jgi:hypothetical protein
MRGLFKEDEPNIRQTLATVLRFQKLTRSLSNSKWSLAAFIDKIEICPGLKLIV